MSEIKRRDIARVDLSKPLKPERVNGVQGMFDNGSIVGAEVYRDGEPVDLTGCTAVAYVTKPDGSALTLDGTIEGNTVTVQLHYGTMNVSGRHRVSIVLQSKQIRQTLRVINGFVYATAPADHWNGAVMTGAVQTGANQITLTWKPNVDSRHILWEAYEVVDGVYNKVGTTFTGECVVYDVPAGQHMYCVRAVFEEQEGKYSDVATAWVDANWTA